MRRESSIAGGAVAEASVVRWFGPVVGGAESTDADRETIRMRTRGNQPLADASGWRREGAADREFRRWFRWRSESVACRREAGRRTSPTA